MNNRAWRVNEFFKTGGHSSTFTPFDLVIIFFHDCNAAIIKIRIFLLLSIFTCLAACSVPSPNSKTVPTVRLDTGLVQGEEKDSLLIYRGIPYAAAPIGDLRWQPPQAVKIWSGIRKTTKFGAACVQPHVSDAPWAQVGPQSENCLFLNIWQPKSTGTPLPVMVFIHGGSLRAGAAGVPLYDGTKLAERGTVIVTINYRLSRLGYFAHPALTVDDTDALTGNYGMMDQIAALKWVQRNINVFNGDPKNVTIFGESAGAVSVQALMASPITNGLFAKAISQSGGGYFYARPLQAAKAISNLWANKQGLPNATAEQLRALPADQIATANDLIGLMTDGRLLLGSPIKSFLSKSQAKVPFIIGGNSYEASLKALNQDLVKIVVGKSYSKLLKGYQNIKGSRISAEQLLVTQAIAIQPSRHLAEQQAKIGQPSYVYYFEQQPASERKLLPGAVHGGELSYIFGTRLNAEIWDEEDERVSQLMGDYWVQFAKTGNPNGPKMPNWAPVTPSSSRILDIDGAAAFMRNATPLEDATFKAGVITVEKFWGIKK